jgi:hypothetical protein
MTTANSTRKDLPEHPDVEIVEATKAFDQLLRLDVYRFRHRLFSGECRRFDHADRAAR